MDPVSIVGLVEGSISLAVQCGSVAKSLNNLAGQYKYAKLTISTMVQNLDIMQLAWDRIVLWSKDGMSTDDDTFTQRLNRFLETGALVLDALEEELQSYDISNITFSQRSRLVWNDTIMQGHQTRIRDQAQSMCLLLQAIQLPTPQATNLLQRSEKQFMKSDESAFSIVPSEMSSRLSMSTDQTGRRDSISSYTSMIYRRLSFENDLFTARAYKRNYRTPRLQRFWKRKPNSDHETITSREVKSQVVGADSMAPTLSKAPTIDHSSSGGVNTKGKTLGAGHTVDSHVPDIHSEVDDQGPGEPLLATCRTTTEGFVIPGLTYSRKCDSLHVCPTQFSFIQDIDFMESLLQNGGPEYDGDHGLRKMMYCARGVRWLPFHVVAMTGNLPMVQLLLETGLSVNAQMEHGIQAIHLAARSGSINVLKALIDAGADVNSKDQDGYQPLHYFSDSQDNPAIIRYLAENGAEVNSLPYSEEQTPLYLTCKNDFIGNLEVLMSLGALEGGTQALQSERAFHAAIIYRSPKSLEALLRYGIDANTRWSDGCMALHKFVSTYYNRSLRDSAADKRILQLLLEYTDLLAKDQNGDTLLSRLFRLQEISEKEDLELARLFLESLPKHKTLEAKLLRSMINRSLNNRLNLEIVPLDQLLFRRDRERL